MDHSAGAPDLDVLYRQIQPALLRLLRHAHAELAEDIAADVWVEVATALPRFVGDDAAFRAWVFCLARRRVIDCYRRAGRRPVERMRVVEPMHEAVDRPEDDAISRLSAEATIAAVHKLLTPDQAEVVLLRVVGGFKVDRVARVTGKQPVNVRVTQHRALRRLAEDWLPNRRPA